MAKRMRKRLLELDEAVIARPGRKPVSHIVSSGDIVDALKEHSYECGWSNRHQRWKYKVRGSLRRLLPQLRLPRLGYSTICRRIQGGRLGVSQSFQRGGMCDYCKEFDNNLEPTLHKVMNELSKRLNDLFSESLVQAWRQHVAAENLFPADGFRWASSPEFMDGFLAFV